jgi:hypothetical protein
MFKGSNLKPLITEHLKFMNNLRNFDKNADEILDIHLQ